MSDSNKSNRTPYLGTRRSIIGVLLACALFGTLAFLGGRQWDTRQYNTGRDYQEAKQNALQSCIGREGPAAVECVAKAVETAQNNKAAQQDLHAQQDMADWAFWMVMLSFGTVCVTGIGVWYVKKTLETNSDFLAESVETRKIMERQNALSEQTQRPWISIDLRITKFTVTNMHLSFEYEFTYTNIGKTVARDVRRISNTEAMNNNFVKDIADRFSTHRERPDTNGVQIMPGESIEEIGACIKRFNMMPWYHRSGKTINIILFAAAFYQNDGVDIQFETSRTFRIGPKGTDLYQEFNFRAPISTMLKAENIAVVACDPSQTS